MRQYVVAFSPGPRVSHSSTLWDVEYTCELWETSGAQTARPANPVGILWGNSKTAKKIEVTF